jgi:phosphonate metabolism protein PhnN/1,5-bisphosphokinase (PRPP-forming)
MLVLIVGVSGAGKDTLLLAARDGLADDHRFRFVRRVVTRPPGVVGEEYDSLTDQEFELQRESGGFALAWRAHGLRYGIPADISLDIAQGRVVVANVSRAVVAEAAQRFPVRVVEVRARPDLIARRLAARGRDDAVDVARRLARQIELPLPVEREIVTNDGTVAEGARRLVAVLTRAASGVPPS